MTWQPIETKPPLTHVEERGEYRTDDGMLWYFKPTHWRPFCAEDYLQRRLRELHAAIEGTDIYGRKSTK